MSEDLRYYFFDNDAEPPPPPIPAEDAWKQMSSLLDKHMPVEKEKRRFIYWPYAVAASVLLAGLFLVLKFAGISNNQQQTIVKAEKEIQPETPVKEGNAYSKSPAANNQDAISKPANSDIADKNKLFAEKFFSSQTTEKTKNASTVNNSFRQQNKQSDEAIISQHQSPVTTQETVTVEEKANSSTKNSLPEAGNPSTSKNTEAEKNTLAPQLTLPDETREAAEKTVAEKKKLNYKKSWGLTAGVGMNMVTTGNGQSLQPYPQVEARYNITPRLFVSAGLSAFAPAGTTATGIDKSVPLNNTDANVLKYDEITTYNQFRYLDVPLMAGVNVTKRISLQGGVQVSRLLSNSSEKSVQAYDFDMNRVDMALQTLVDLPVGPTMAIPVENSVTIRNTDYRYIAGINYSLSRATFGLQYQQGFKPMVTGNSTVARKTNLVSLRVSFRLK